MFRHWRIRRGQSFCFLSSSGNIVFCTRSITLVNQLQCVLKLRNIVSAELVMVAADANLPGWECHLLDLDANWSRLRHNTHRFVVTNSDGGRCDTTPQRPLKRPFLGKDGIFALLFCRIDAIDFPTNSCKSILTARKTEFLFTEFYGNAWDCLKR